LRTTIRATNWVNIPIGVTCLSFGPSYHCLSINNMTFALSLLTNVNAVYICLLLILLSRKFLALTAISEHNAYLYIRHAVVYKLAHICIASSIQEIIHAYLCYSSHLDSIISNVVHFHTRFRFILYILATVHLQSLYAEFNKFKIFMNMQKLKHPILYKF
jgi:hypothetical protein